MKRRKKKNILIACGILAVPVTMYLTLLGYFIYASHTDADPDAIRFVVVDEPQTYFEGAIDEFYIKLHDFEGRCLLSYSKNISANGEGRDVEVGMAAPCNFIRASRKEFKPLSYTYQTGAKRVTVLLVTGGTPDPVHSDVFLPKGCGTSLQKVVLYIDRIGTEGSDPLDQGVWCPSSGVDEVFFAA